MKTRLQLIREAATRESSAEQWRDRMDEWLNLQTVTIVWPKAFEVFETNWPKLFRSFRRNL